MLCPRRDSCIATVCWFLIIETSLKAAARRFVDADDGRNGGGATPIPGLTLSFRYTLNVGGALGTFRFRDQVLTMLVRLASFVFLVALGFPLLGLAFPLRWAYAGMIAGSLSNTLDVFLWDGVVDYVSYEIRAHELAEVVGSTVSGMFDRQTPITGALNLSDVWITVGTGAILVVSLIGTKNSSVALRYRSVDDEKY